MSSKKHSTKAPLRGKETASGDNDLPPGWVRMESRSKPGAYYYAHPATKRTQIEKPTFARERLPTETIPSRGPSSIAQAIDTITLSGKQNTNIVNSLQDVKAKRKTEEETHRRVEARKAEEEAKRKKAEEESRKRADVNIAQDVKAKRKAEEEASKRVEARKAEEEARRKKAEEELRKRAEEEEEEEAAARERVLQKAREKAREKATLQDTDEAQKSGASRRGKKRKAWLEDEDDSDEGVTQEDLEKWRENEEREENAKLEAERLRKEQEKQKLEEEARLKREEARRAELEAELEADAVEAEREAAAVEAELEAAAKESESTEEVSKDQGHCAKEADDDSVIPMSIGRSTGSVPLPAPLPSSVPHPISFPPAPLFPQKDAPLDIKQATGATAHADHGRYHQEINGNHYESAQKDALAKFNETIQSMIGNDHVSDDAWPSAKSESDAKPHVPEGHSNGGLSAGDGWRSQLPSTETTSLTPSSFPHEAVRESGTINWYNGRRQSGCVWAYRDNKFLPIPAEGAPNGQVAPPGPGGLMHGTGVSFLRTENANQTSCCSDVRPDDGQVGLSVGADTQLGQRPTNEDRMVAVDLLEGLGHMVGIFDGHRGTSCVDFLLHQLPNAIVNSCRESLRRGGVFPGMPTGAVSTKDEVGLIRAGLVAGFEAADQDLVSVASKNGWQDGASAIVALIMHGFEAEPTYGKASPCTVPDAPGGIAKVFATWCGTGRMLLLRGRKAVRCTEEHVCSRLDERQWLTNAGALVIQDVHGNWSMGKKDRPDLAWARQQGHEEWTGPKSFLRTSRGFGDILFKRPMPLLSATPDVNVIDLTPDDWALVLVGGGVLAVSADQEIADLCWETMALNGKCPVDAARAITKHAYHRGSTDNLTCIVLRLGWSQPPTRQNEYA